MNQLDRMTRIAGYMVLTILVMAIGGLFIPNDPARVNPEPVQTFYDISDSYDSVYYDSIPEPTPSPSKSVYYPLTYGDENDVDYDLFNDENEIESYYEED